MYFSRGVQRSRAWFELIFILHSIVWVTSALPNFIIFQPDDYVRYEEWDPPAHLPRSRDALISYLNPNLTWVEQLRLGGVSLSRQHTASPACGTSRYSTVTGRYPSRSAYGRDRWSDDVSDVLINRVKLANTDDLTDCSDHNVATVLSQHGYRTGIVGKWHLTAISTNSYSYEGLQAEINGCGFTFAEALYGENLNSNFYPDGLKHNMEYVTDKGIDFIDEAVGAGEPFFLYFNPTVPHGSGDVSGALLSDYSCLNTPEGVLDEEPDVPYMTEGTDCESYRASVVERAGGPTATSKELGAMWVDDSIGSLYQRLEELGELNNTFFLFQQDHGQEGKASLYEPGTRMSSFVHYPDRFPVGEVFTGLTTTLDIAPTVMELAGLDENSAGMYDMDGKSWVSAVEGLTDEMDDRCIISEYEQDRALVCGCNKFIYINDSGDSTTLTKGNRWNLYSGSDRIFFNLCDQEGNYAISPMDSPELAADAADDPIHELLELYMACHLNQTNPQADMDFATCFFLDGDDDDSGECPETRSSVSTFFGAICDIEGGVDDGDEGGGGDDSPTEAPSCP